MMRQDEAPIWRDAGLPDLIKEVESGKSPIQALFSWQAFQSHTYLGKHLSFRPKIAGSHWTLPPFSFKLLPSATKP